MEVKAYEAELQAYTYEIRAYETELQVHKHDIENQYWALAFGVPMALGVAGWYMSTDAFVVCLMLIAGLGMGIIMLIVLFSCE